MRSTRFVTADSPDVVVQFYAAALVEHGSYMMVDREHKAVVGEGSDWRLSDEGERATFEHETFIDRTDYSDLVADGYRVTINAAPEGDRTAVWVINYQYERFLRACHPW